MSAPRRATTPTLDAMFFEASLAEYLPEQRGIVFFSAAQRPLQHANLGAVAKPVEEPIPAAGSGCHHHETPAGAARGDAQQLAIGILAAGICGIHPCTSSSVRGGEATTA